MAEPLKFTFDTVFGRTGQSADACAPALSYSEDEIAQLKNEAFELGLAQGRAELRESMDQTMSTALARLAEKADDLDMVQQGELQRIRGEAAELAHEIAGKLAAALTSNMPLTETRVLLEECLSHLNETPHIVVRVTEELAANLREQADTLASERGFSGKIMIMAEPDMPPGDCRIEWADGGIERNAGALREKIDRAVTRHVDAMMSSAGTKADAAPENPELPESPESPEPPAPEHMKSEGVAS